MRREISVREDPVGITVAVIFPYSQKEPGSAIQVAQQLTARMHSAQPSFQAWMPDRIDPDANRITLKTRDVWLGQQREGILNILVNGTNIILSGYSVPTQAIAQRSSLMAQILSSFRPIESIPRQVFQEPSENAYTLRIPKGWTAQASVNRSTGAGAPTFNVMRDSQGLVSAGMPSYHWTFKTDLSGILGQLGASQSLPYMTAAQFCQYSLVPWMSQSQAGLKVEAIVDRPDLSEMRTRDLAAGGFPPGTMEVTTVFLETSYEENGVRLRQKTFVTTKHQVNQVGFVAFWDADLSNYYRAPEAEFEAWKPVLGGILDSMQYNPAWEAAEVQRIQGRIAVSRMDTQRRLRQISQTVSETSDMMYNSYRNRQASDDRIAEKRSDATLGVHPVESPSGDVYKVPDGYDQYWKDGLGNFYGGNSLTEPDIDWTPLSDTGD